MHYNFQLISPLFRNICLNMRPFRLLAIFLLSAGNAAAAERLSGPVAADPIRVIDGDSLVVRAHIWLGQSVETIVRIRGIDAPETDGKCREERILAAAATDRLRELAASDGLLLSNIEPDKYGGRVLSDVGAGGRDVGAAMLQAGLARPYEGGARGGWCNLAEKAG
jgi:endonuclease YncB( thermonuclease family)